MRSRREAREKAVQFLFQHEVNPVTDFKQSLLRFWRLQGIDESEKSSESQAMRQFSDSLVQGVLDHQQEIDRIIIEHARNWDFDRLAAVDRNVLRLAIFEMLHRHDIPPVVSINEAVEISKRFSTKDSGKFVNGILDRVKQDLMRPARLAVPPQESVAPETNDTA